MLGGIAATLGIICPSIVIILVIASLLGQVSEMAIVQSAFAGIRPVVGALIAGSVIKLFRSNVKNPLQIILCVAAFVIVAFLGTSPVWIVVAEAIIGLAVGGRQVKDA